MWILGISAFYHDAASVLLKDGVIIAAVQEERFTRKKHDQSFPRNSIRWCLEYAGITIDQIDILTFYEKPFLKFERLLETYYAFAPRGLSSFAKAMPIWIKEKLFIKYLLKKEMEEAVMQPFPGTLKLLFSDHHMSHAASAFYPSPYSKAAILTIDGVGEWTTTAIGYGKGNQLKLLKEIQYPHSLGLLYSAFTFYTGFKVNSGEYKMMGLSPYGNPESERTKKYISLIYEYLVDVKEDGSLWLNMEYFDYAVGLKMVKEDAWHRLLGIPRRESETGITQEYIDLACAIQVVTEDIVLRMAKHAKEITDCRYLTMAGGVAFNCVANGKLRRSRLFDDLWIQPAAGDAGGALGAVLATWYMYCDRPRDAEAKDMMKGCYLGPGYCLCEVERMANKFNAAYEKYERFDDLLQIVAKLLSKGHVIGWFQGRMEWGPRALGNRSILADARDKSMQKKLNLKIKFREGFRPFAPSVLNEDVKDYFEIDRASPYMLFVADVVRTRRKAISDSEKMQQMNLTERLAYPRSDVPAVTHIDYSARVQTVHEETNPRFHQLLKTFKRLTGYGILINTSFNVRGEPIVMSPEHAFICFMRTDMDYLVVENCLFEKSRQGTWNEGTEWQKEYELD